MNNLFEKLTHAMSEALDGSISLALHNQNQEVEPIHLLWKLATGTNSPLNQVMNKFSSDKKAVELEIRSYADKLPKVSSV